jgi:FkbM family methyltransferase
MNVIKHCRSGLMLFNSNDAYIGKSFLEYGEFSQGEVDLFEAIIKPGMTVLDIGANIGAFSIPFAQMVGPQGTVFAYEPQRMCYYLLCANVALNNLTNVICLQNAVGKEGGRIDVPELDFGKPANFGGLELGKDYPEARSKCSVKLIKLDETGFAKVDFIKIDVEGMEPDVFMGARELIRRDRPFIYMECDRGENMSLLVKLAKAASYDIYFHAPQLYNSDNYLRNPRNEFGPISSINMLCWPQEVAFPLDVAKYQMSQLTDASQGKVAFKKNPAEKEAIHESINKNVLDALLTAANYYSEALFDHDRSLAFCKMAVQVNSEPWGPYYQAGLNLCRKGDYAAALPFFDIAANKNPEDFKIRLNRATVLGGLGRFEDAVTEYHQAIALQPANASGHYYLSCCLLAMGRYEESWSEGEWRFKMPKVQQYTRLLPIAPMWDGKAKLTGKRILLFCEQGAGDMIQHVRYAKDVKALGAHVTVACLGSLIRLLQQCEGIDDFVLFGSDDPNVLDGKYDYLCSVMDLPRYFGIKTVENYIHPSGESPHEVDETTFNIGIAWAGNDIHAHDFTRSCHLHRFECLQIPGVKLYSLQKDKPMRIWQTVGQVNLRDGGEGVQLVDYVPEFKDFDDTAAFMKKLDMVITVDTAVGHLAACMGIPTWLALGFYPDPRWLKEKTDTKWYPSMRLFRSPNYTPDWEAVFNSIRCNLVVYLHRQRADGELEGIAVANDLGAGQVAPEQGVA